jgi:hypothetical protein
MRYEENKANRISRYLNDIIWNNKHDKSQKEFTEVPLSPC